MFDSSETGPEITGNTVRFRVFLPSIDQNRGFAVKAYVIAKAGQFDANVPPTICDLTPAPTPAGVNPAWGDVNKTCWQSQPLSLNPGVYLYRFEITGPANGGTGQVRSLYFGDPCARETDTGVFSVLRMPANAPFQWTDTAFKVPTLDDVVMYEMNVAEFAGTFSGVAARIPYLCSLGVNVIELLPINSIAEPTQWGYMPIFYFAPEERFGGPQELKALVNQCHANGIAVVLDMVYAHTDRMFPYQIGYERFFSLWCDDNYSDATGVHRAPNPLVCAYDNFGKKNDWRMSSTREFFAAVNAFWMQEYHIDGFRYDHVNGFLDRKPIEKAGKIDWYSQENRPTFASLQELSKSTYNVSKQHARFQANAQAPSRLIQIAEDLCESAYQLSPTSASAINGCWEKRVADLARDMARYNFLSNDLGKELLLADDRFGTQGYTGKKNVGADVIPALVVQFIESHDECRLFYLMQHRDACGDAGYEYRNGLDDQPWWKLQPYGIALMTSVGIPMLWSGQEFAENTGLAQGGQARVRGYRPLHWDYFYNAALDPGGSTVLPLVALYRKLGTLRHQLSALRGPRENAKEEYRHQDDQVLVYRRWMGKEVLIIALNFSDADRHVPIAMGEVGVWTDVLDAALGAGTPYTKSATDPAKQEWVHIPSNFGRIMRIVLP